MNPKSFSELFLIVHSSYAEFKWDSQTSYTYERVCSFRGRADVPGYICRNEYQRQNLSDTAYAFFLEDFKMVPFPGCTLKLNEIIFSSDKKLLSPHNPMTIVSPSPLPPHVDCRVPPTTTRQRPNTGGPPPTPKKFAAYSPATQPTHHPQHPAYVDERKLSDASAAAPSPPPPQLRPGPPVK